MHYCRVRRLPEGAPAHDALQVSVELLAGTTSAPDWRRKPGRPRSSWLRGVLRDVHLTAQEVWTAADDREGWRAQWSSADYASDDDDDGMSLDQIKATLRLPTVCCLTLSNNEL